jgi:hypothetical protein
MPKISGRKHEERKTSTNQIGNALEVENGITDGISLAKVLSLSRPCGVCVLCNFVRCALFVKICYASVSFDFLLNVG